MRNHSKVRYNTKKSEYKNKKRKVVYGLDEEQFNTMVNKQYGLCAICLYAEEKALCVDHSHSTGKIRGLLCQKCNKGLGLFKDNPENLDRAAIYLRKNQ